MPLLDRRTLVTGSLAAGLSTTAIATLVAAQDATPTTGDDPTTTTDPAADSSATDLTARLQARLDALTTDLEAVRADIDATIIDALVAEATTSIGVIGNATEPRRSAAAAATLIHGAGLLLDAQLEYAGLPSQEAPSSHVLAGAHATITDASDLTSASIDTSLYTSTAQTLYTDAYDLYGSGAWAQAAATAYAAAILATGASVLLGTADSLGGESGFVAIGGGPGRGFGIVERPGSGMKERFATDEDLTTPITVPAPDFTTN